MRFKKPEHRFPLSGLTVAGVCLVALLAPAGASSLTLPGTVQPMPGINKVVPLARKELVRQVRERGSDNVPRYHRGRGRVAPYSIADSWCVAFATWVWSRAGFDDYLGTDLIWRSEDGTKVAIQVKDLSRWAQRTGHWSYRARPGFLIAYGRSHMGVVRKVDRQGRAVLSIEGNMSDRVSGVVVPMNEVTGYISPVQLMAGQNVSRRSALADVD